MCTARLPGLWRLIVATLCAAAPAGFLRPAAAAPAKRPLTAKPAEGANNDLDVAYLGPDRHEKMNVHWPAGGDPGGRFPCVILVHGGGYGAGDKDDGQFPHALVTRLVDVGFVVANINYLLSLNDPHDTLARSVGTLPRVQWDFDAAVRFLRANADEYRIDPGRVGAWGWSAGGWLITHAALSTGADTMPIPISHEGKAKRDKRDKANQVLAPMDDPRPAYGAFPARVSALAFDFFEGLEYASADDPACLTYVGRGGDAGGPVADPPPTSPAAAKLREVGVPVTEVAVASRKPEPVVHVPSTRQTVTFAGRQMTLEDAIVEWFKQQLIAAPVTIAPEVRPFVRGFAGQTEVTLLAASPDAKVYFTTDGTEPTERSPAYSTPIRLTDTATVKALSVRPGEQPSRVTSATFTKGADVPPTITGPEPVRLPPARVGQPYAGVRFTSNAGDRAVVWAVNGSIPTTFSIDPTTGAFTGTPDRPGTFVVQVYAARHPGGLADARSYVLTVEP